MRRLVPLSSLPAYRFRHSETHQRLVPLATDSNGTYCPDLLDAYLYCPDQAVCFAAGTVCDPFDDVSNGDRAWSTNKYFPLRSN